MFKHLTIPDQEGKAIEWNGEVCLSFATNACLECVFVVFFFLFSFLCFVFRFSVKLIIQYIFQDYVEAGTEGEVRYH